VLSAHARIALVEHRVNDNLTRAPLLQSVNNDLLTRHACAKAGARANSSVLYIYTTVMYRMHLTPCLFLSVA